MAHNPKFDRRVKSAMSTSSPKTKVKILLNAAQIYNDALKGNWSHVRSSYWDAWNLSMERGLGIEVFTMSPTELQARVKEQNTLERESKLKYRGITYYKSYKN